MDFSWSVAHSGFKNLSLVSAKWDEHVQINFTSVLPAPLLLGSNQDVLSSSSWFGNDMQKFKKGRKTRLHIHKHILARFWENEHVDVTVSERELAHLDESCL